MRTGLPTAAIGVAVALFTVASGCKKSHKAEQAYLALGEQVARGNASDLRTTPDGEVATYLIDGEKPRMDGIPAQMLVGELYAVPTRGGEARKLGNGVTNVPGGYTFSPDSKWALLLAGYNPVAQTGTLIAADLSDPRSEPVELGTNVSYMLAGPDSKTVAYVAGGVLNVGELPKGPFKPVAGEVQTASFTRDGKALVYKRRLTAAGGLFLLPLGTDQAKKLGEQVGDFLLAPDSARIAFTQRSEVNASTYDLFMASAPGWERKQVAVGTGAFAFSADGKWLGRTEGQRPDQLGDLFVGPADGSPGRKLGTQVNEFEFAPRSNAVAMLELYDISARAGVLAVAELPDGKAKRVGNRVPNFDWSPDGRSVAFVSRFLKPIYSIDLMLYPLGAEKAFKVNPGVFGYNYDPKARYLVFRTNCLNEGRVCDLMKLDLAQPQQPATRVLEGIYTFKPSTDGERLLVTYARRDSKLYDAAVYNVGKNERKTVGQFIELPPLFTNDQDNRVVYVVGSNASPGVYVAKQIP